MLISWKQDRIKIKSAEGLMGRYLTQNYAESLQELNLVNDSFLQRTLHHFSNYNLNKFTITSLFRKPIFSYFYKTFVTKFQSKRPNGS